MTLWTSESSTAMNSMTVIMPSNPHVKPIAPRINNSRQQRDVQVDSTTTTATTTTSAASKTSNKRKIAFHPSLGYAIPPPIPPKVARRNARERNRVKQVNNGFDVLRSHIPTAAKNKKMSKVDTLRHAVDYIRNLKKMLKEQDLSNGIKCEIDSDTEFDFDEDDFSQQSFDDSIVSSPSSSTTTTFATSSSSPSLTAATTTISTITTVKTPRFSAQNFPMTPRTPDSTSEFILNNIPPALIPPTTTLNVGSVESNYDATSYYSQTSSLMSPDSGHFSLHHNQQLHHHNQHHQLQHQHQQQQPQPHHLLTPVFHPTDHHQQHDSPVNSVETSPSIFSESSAFFASSALPTNVAVPQNFYYSDFMEPNSEEDELLDTIVKWQDD